MNLRPFCCPILTAALLAVAVACIFSCKVRRAAAAGETARSWGTPSPGDRIADTAGETATARGQAVDTARMVKSFVDNKGNYKNKELGALLKDLPIPVRSVFLLNHRVDSVDGLDLAFDDRQTALNKTAADLRHGTNIRLHIVFATPMPTTIYNAHPLTFGNAWDENDKKYFSPQIIGDIW
jgi:hypothetical protein